MEEDNVAGGPARVAKDASSDASPESNGDSRKSTGSYDEDCHAIEDTIATSDSSFQGCVIYLSS